MSTKKKQSPAVNQENALYIMCFILFKVKQCAIHIVSKAQQVILTYNTAISSICKWKAILKENKCIANANE